MTTKLTEEQKELSENWPEQLGREFKLPIDLMNKRLNFKNMKMLIGWIIAAKDLEASEKVEEVVRKERERAAEILDEKVKDWKPKTRLAAMLQKLKYKILNNSEE